MRLGQTREEWATEQRAFRAQRVHDREQVTTPGPLTCSECGRERRTQETLRAHRAIVHGIDA